MIFFENLDNILSLNKCMWEHDLIKCGLFWSGMKFYFSTAIDCSAFIV